jgi:YidC/Oxa1 family membrane protein insertase
MNSNVRSFFKSLILWFCVFYLLFSGYQWLLAPDPEAPVTTGELSLELVDKTPVEGQLLQFRFNNETDQDWQWTHFCDNNQSLELLALVASKEVSVNKPDCGNFAPEGFTVAAQSTAFVNLTEYNTELFNTPGNYRLEWEMTSGEEIQTLTTAEFEVKEAGWVRKSFRFLITQPLFNALVFFIEILPTHSLGWSIVLLTVCVRILLFLPNQKAMKSQRKLQKLQPHIQSLRKKHKDNQQMLAMETMAMYKKHKINPMSSCLPMLLQMPFLIGIYLVVKDGLSPHLSHLLYGFHADADLSIVDTYFFGLDLEVPNIWVLPVLVAIAQFIAIKLSMAAAKKQQPAKAVEKSKKGKKDEAPDMMEQMEQMQKMMLWLLPLMIGFFTATFPAAVGIYWLTSTVFGIGQQKLVNWQLDKPQVRRKDA